MERKNGIIIKGIGGFYYVEAAGEIYECKARGINRRIGVTPLAGDVAEITINESGYHSLDRICERRNALLRPPIANVDKMFIVVSTCEPVPSTLVIDKLTAIAQDKLIDCSIIISKADLADYETLKGIYEHSGFNVYVVSSVTGEGVDEVRNAVSDGISVFAGNSGVGKSSLLNRLDPRLELSTAEISEKLRRGKHTTRQVELYKFGNGYIADTPGFAAIDFCGEEAIIKENLPFCFKEFLPFLGECRFSSCKHINDKGCKILEAMENGEIEKSRHDSYVEMYNEVKDIKEWENK